MASTTTSTAEATQYLSTFLNRTLHLHTTDGRMFAGQMKCTDPQRNIILSMTHEYRQPSAQDIQLAAQRHERSGKSGNVKVDLKKRFVGLVVVPGEYITKIEVEE
jgi:small nuclear ribonucleoprotein (snRNP)-like protein